MRIISLLSSLLLLTAAAATQNAVPPSPKPEPDSGPSLEVTMKFIQDKMNAQGQLGYTMEYSANDVVTHRYRYLLSGVVADPARCTLQTMENEGYDRDFWHPGGNEIKPFQYKLEKGTIPFKDVESITVESLQEVSNRGTAAAGHPDNVVTVVPPIFQIHLVSSKPAFTSHIDGTQWTDSGSTLPIHQDLSSKGFNLKFRDEQIANRLAKAMAHAVELCGGKNEKEPF